MKKTALVGALLALALSACSNTPSTPKENARVDGNELLSRYQNMRPRDEFSERSEALNIVREEAMSIGTQAGLYWAASEINQMLLDHSYLLNEIDFAPLLIDKRRYFIIPPVITEDEGTRVLSTTGRSIRLIDKTYRIEREPRFALEPPTWHDYLLISVSPPNRPAEALLGSDADEIRAWEQGVADGWDIGVEQALLTHQNKVMQLTNDYQGMIRYHILLTQNMVSSPQINESYQPIAGGGRRLVIEESNVEITVNPSLNSNRYSWEVVPQLPDISHLFPDSIYLNIGRQN